MGQVLHGCATTMHAVRTAIRPHAGAGCATPRSICSAAFCSWPASPVRLARPNCLPSASSHSTPCRAGSSWRAFSSTPVRRRSRLGCPVLRSGLFPDARLAQADADDHTDVDWIYRKHGALQARRLDQSLDTAWLGIAKAAAQGAQGLVGVFQEHHGPEGTLARTLPVISSIRW